MLKKEKIVICEPYSYRGGHPLKNVNFFSRLNIISNFNVSLYVDRGNKKSEKKHIIKYFKEKEVFETKNFNKKVYNRIEEFKNLIINNKNTILVFTTTYEEDIVAWLTLLDKAMLDIIYENNIKIIIHSGFSIYHNFWLYKKRLLEINRFSKNVFFTFFTELQAFVVKELFSIDNISYLYFPHYTVNKFTKYNKKKITIGHIGDFSRYKNPHRIYEIAKKNKDFNFFIHFSRLNQDNVLLFNKLRELKNIKCKIGILSDSSYKNILRKLDFLLLPYDIFEYSIRGSGIFEEAVMNNIIPLVPKSTWMGYILERFNLTEIILEDDLSNIEGKIKNCLNNKKEIIKKIGVARKIFINEREPNNFMENILKIVNMGNNFNLNDYNISKKDKRIKNGIFSYYVNTSLFFLGMGKIDIARQIYSKIENKKIYYSEYKRLKLLLKQNGKKSFYYIDLSTQSLWNILNPLYRIKSKKELLKNFYLLSLESLIKITMKLNKKQALYLWKELTSKEMKIEKNIMKYLQSNVLSKYLYLFHLLSKKTNNKKKTTKHLKLTIKDIFSPKASEPLFIYNLSSLLKNDYNFNLAIVGFLKVASSSNENNLKAGAYFHLGEIELALGNKKKALSYFKKCLELNPEHKKAKEYIKKSQIKKYNYNKEEK